jgi:hypothetical protein
MRPLMGDALTTMKKITAAGAGTSTIMVAVYIDLDCNPVNVKMSTKLLKEGCLIVP